MQVSMIYQKGLEITSLDLLALMHSKEWHIEITKQQLLKRIQSGNYFKAIIDAANEEDVSFIRQEYNLAVELGGIIPVGLLETIAIQTNGNYNSVPKSINELTNNGYWSIPDQDADTLILVDITVLPTRRGSKGKGEAKQLILSSFEDFKQSHYKFFWSYTPNIEQIKNWHKSLGSEDTNHKILCARPKYNTNEVNMMNYSKVVASLREESLLVVSSTPTSIKY